jgi:DNA-directed RNA polymerase subunit RPC12/RpoP
MSEGNTRAQGQYCPKCQSRKIVEGKLGEASRFYPARPLFKALKGKPVALSLEYAYACVRCGLTWSQVDPDELQDNIVKYGLERHGTAVMRIVDGIERTGALELPEPTTPQVAQRPRKP